MAMFNRVIFAAALAIQIWSGCAFYNSQIAPTDITLTIGTQQSYFPSTSTRLNPLSASNDKRGRDEKRRRRQRNHGNKLPPSSSSIPDRVPAVLPPGQGSHDNIEGQLCFGHLHFSWTEWRESEFSRVSGFVKLLLFW